MEGKQEIKKTKTISKYKKNEKIGRPCIRDNEQQFKLKFLKNQKRFQIEAQLLVNIYEIFRKQQIQICNIQNRVPQLILCAVFQQFHMNWLYAALYQNNRQYYQDQKRIQDTDGLEYTSIIDVSYMFRLISLLKKNHGILIPALSVKEIFGIILFYLDNEKLVNDSFLNYYINNFVNNSFEKIMFNGPNVLTQIPTVTILLVMLTLEILQKQNILIQQPNVEILRESTRNEGSINQIRNESALKKILVQNDNNENFQIQKSNNEQIMKDTTQSIDNVNSFKNDQQQQQVNIK